MDPACRLHSSSAWVLWAGAADDWMCPPTGCRACRLGGNHLSGGERCREPKRADAVDRRGRALSNDGSSPPIPLVGDGLTVPCVDGQERPYLNLDAAASTNALPAVPDGCTSSCPGTPACIGERATSPVRPPPPTKRPAPPPWRFAGRSRRRPRRRDHLSQHHRGHQPSGLPVAPRARRRRRHHRGRAPRQPAALGPAVPPALRRVRTGRHLRPSTTSAAALDAHPQPAAAGRHRRVERQRVAAADRRASSPPPTTGESRSWSTPPSWPPTARCPLGRLPGLERAQDVRPLRGRRSSSARGPPSLTGDPFLAGGGAVDLVDLDEVVWTDPPDREEAGSPNVRRRGRPARAPSTSSSGIGWPTPSPPTTSDLARRLRAGLAAHRRGSRCSARTRASTRCRWPPSPSRGFPTPWSRLGSAPSTASGSATAASAPTPT